MDKLTEEQKSAKDAVKLPFMKMQQYADGSVYLIVFSALSLTTSSQRIQRPSRVLFTWIRMTTYLLGRTLMTIWTYKFDDKGNYNFCNLRL